MVRYGLVWFGLVWYGLVWYGMVKYFEEFSGRGGGYQGVPPPATSWVKLDGRSILTMSSHMKLFDCRNV